MSNPKIKIVPPYKRYNIPSEFAQIQKERKAVLKKLQKKVVKDASISINPAIDKVKTPLSDENSKTPTVGSIPLQRADTVAATAEPSISRTAQTIEKPATTARGIPLTTELKSVSTPVAGANTTTSAQIPAAAPVVKNSSKSTATAQPTMMDTKAKTIIETPPASTAKVATGPVIMPSGVVNNGFNCPIEFLLYNPGPSDYDFWGLRFKVPPPIGGYADVWLKAVESGKDLQVLMDYTTDFIQPYLFPDHSVKFTGLCETVLGTDIDGNPIVYPPIVTPEVVLNFSPLPCVGLHSISLSANIFVGGKNDKAPTLHMQLDAPAPPWGQKVYLSVSNNKIASIHPVDGSDTKDHDGKYYTIPAGKSSDSLSWFLGTKSVLKMTSFHVKARVNNTEGVVEVVLKRK